VYEHLGATHLSQLSAKCFAVVPDVKLDRCVLGPQLVQQVLGVDAERAPAQSMQNAVDLAALRHIIGAHRCNPYEWQRQLRLVVRATSGVQPVQS